MARSAHAYVRGKTSKFYESLETQAHGKLCRARRFHARQQLGYLVREGVEGLAGDDSQCSPATFI
jgi:hypothetical protein